MLSKQLSLILSLVSIFAMTPTKDASALFAGINNDKAIFKILGVGSLISGLYQIGIAGPGSRYAGRPGYSLVAYSWQRDDEATLVGVLFVLGGLALDRELEQQIELDSGAEVRIVEEDLKWEDPVVKAKILADLALVDQSDEEASVKVPSHIMDFIRGNSISSFEEFEKHECGMIVEVQKLLSKLAAEQHKLNTGDSKAKYEVGMATALYLVEKVTVYESELTHEEINNRKGTSACVYDANQNGAT